MPRFAFSLIHQMKIKNTENEQHLLISQIQDNIRIMEAFKIEPDIVTKKIMKKS